LVVPQFFEPPVAPGLGGFGFRSERLAVFLFGFAKSERDNIDDDHPHPEAIQLSGALLSDASGKTG
jgi:hypothetical protein